MLSIKAKETNNNKIMAAYRTRENEKGSGQMKQTMEKIAMEQVAHRKFIRSCQDDLLNGIYFPSNKNKFIAHLV
jgi:signal recognition particle GTPase